ncbi:MAG: B12-binding domain-containing radical SAM protein [Deltaproteobacteria bacterium]|nr:B12-binding domain-containing radical SAM protein [Deltaproteobacteria bacterium]
MQPTAHRPTDATARRARRILLVHPLFPVTYWGFQYALPMSGRRANLPPLGLATLAALLPDTWELKLVDMNVADLRDEDLRWADLAFVGGMRVQAPSMLDVLERASILGLRTVVGGPAPTSDPDLFAEANVVFRGEAEGRIDALIAAIDAPDEHVVVAQSEQYPDPKTFSVPRFDLFEVEAYGAMSLQYSRGCPFKCEFCDIVQLFGRVPRPKSSDLLLAEFEAIRATGYRGTVFVVDDNFIGNRKAVRRMLPDLVAWQQDRQYPFDLMTEASVNLADDATLLTGMVQAGFTSVFLGLETPSLEALHEAGKTQNTRKPLSESVQEITEAGLEVMGGFIVGFDSDGAEVFEAQRAFIEDSPIPMAMIGPLMALPETDLWARLSREGRLRLQGTGNDGDQFGRPNFVPAMDEETLLTGYGRLVAQLYTADAYYDRCERVLDLAPPSPGLRAPDPRDLVHFARTAWTIGVRSPRRRRFWRLLAVALRRQPKAFSWAVVRAMIGEHLIRYTEEQVVPRIRDAVAEVRRERREEAVARYA